MDSQSSQHAKGLMLTAIGGIALTTDIPLIRLAEGEPWSILMVRTATTLVAALVIWLVWRALSARAPPLLPGWKGVIVAALYGLGSVTFITAVYSTSTANVVFILAFTTMFSALLSWAFLGQRPPNATLAAMAVMIIGVLIIVWDSIGTGNLFGDLIALSSSLIIASAITVSRSSSEDMGFASLVGVILPLMIGAAMVSQVGYRIDAPWWIIFNGAVVMPIAFYCLATGPRYLSAPEVAMFYLLETVFAPVWVWLIFNERPTNASLVGGTILVLALVAHSAWQLWNGRNRKVQGNVRHPA